MRMKKNVAATTHQIVRANARKVAEQMTQHRTAHTECSGDESSVVGRGIDQPCQVTEVVDVLDAALVE